MSFHYEIKNKRLKELTKKKAEESKIDADELIWKYVNRGIMEDNLDRDQLKELHSEEELKEINKALGLD